MNPVLVALLGSWFRTRRPALIKAAAPLFVEHVALRRGNVRTANDVITAAAASAGFDAVNLFGKGVYAALRNALLATTRAERRKQAHHASKKFDEYLAAPKEDE